MNKKFPIVGHAYI